jgi:YggT family protein
VSQALKIVDLFLEILTWVIIARVILSWIPHNPEKPLFRMLNEVTEPVLAPFRRLLPKSGLPLDISPLVALFVLLIIRQGLQSLF